MTAAAVAALMVALAACGDDEPSGTAASGGSQGTEPGEPAVYQADTIVLESPEHGPQMCQVQLESYPPQCGGPDLVGWDWAQVDGEESARGTTWGTFRVTGTWDGDATALTLTEPATTPPPRDGEGTPDDSQFATPCPRPDGGWKPVDPATTNQAAMDAAAERGQRGPGTAAVWIDQGAEQGWAGLNDPRQLVFNVTTTGDPAALEADIRAVWGGALCVAEAEHSGPELREVAEAISGPNVLNVNANERMQVVTVDTYVPDAALQAELDERYGEGLVELHPWLEPAA